MTPVLPPPAPPLIASPIPELGTAPSPGAADIDGPGTGGGGSGNASGSGEGVEGNGGGTHSEWRSGRIKDSDYPRGPLEAGIGGTTVARVVVSVTGRVDDCIVTRSSGNAELDNATCRVIRLRYRYRPGRDAQGRPVSDEWVEERTWTSDGRNVSDIRP